ncbi:MAG TPA: tripartite tricarboxylate transporter substrate-binding protein [Casimicrobiaceae bacterium]|nr:tripartite tricarboxylate transporter substrate-binding protein [Casimicrobiaceae bacterium]
MRGARAGLLTLLACAMATPVAAAFPEHSLTLVVGAAAGGGIDLTARILAQGLAQALGQPVVVENRPGAGTRIASENVAKASPDGYTLLLTTAAAAIDMDMKANAGGSDARVLAPISTFATTALLLAVKPTLPVQSVAALVALARAKPGTLNFSSSGTGTIGHLCGELFRQRTGTDIVHVPYKGAAPSAAALAAGEVDFTFASLPAMLPFVKAGRVRVLANAGARRSVLLPDVPTMAEAGISGFDASLWYGVFAPDATPRAVIDRLARAIAEVADSAAVAKQLANMGAEVYVNPAGDLAQLVRDEAARWSGVAKTANATIN